MNASYHIIGLIRKKISNEHLTASDTDVSRVLGISRALVSAYKKDTVMSQETLELAQKILQLPPGELSELSMALLLESSPTTRAINAAHRYMIDQAKKYAAPVVALAIVAFGTFYASPENTAFATDVRLSPIIIMRSVAGDAGAADIAGRRPPLAAVFDDLSCNHPRHRLHGAACRGYRADGVRAMNVITGPSAPTPTWTPPSRCSVTPTITPTSG